MTVSNQIPVVVIGGPTAVGKTNLSIQLAKRFNGEIINGDSLQVYRNLNIGTGKITVDEMQGVPHHLFDILNEDEAYDAARFKQDATRHIQDIHARGKLPIVVGGTGLYLEGLLYDLEFGGESSHQLEVRTHWQQQSEIYGTQWLWQQLYERDQRAAINIPYQNVRRVIRALEVIDVTGELFSSQEMHRIQQSVFNECVLILDRPREVLYNRINQRVNSMIAQGLEKEARTLWNKAQGSDWQSMKGIGYKEWIPYFKGEQTQEEAIAAIQQNSRRYAKRQLTWFRNRLKRTHWIDMSEELVSSQQVSRIIESHVSN